MSVSDHGPLDTQPPTPERQEKLRALCETNLALGKPPYAGVKIRSLGELQWIQHEHHWSGDSHVRHTQRPDLRGVNLYNVNLKHAKLFRAHLDGADLAHANLEGAELRAATLVGARLWHTNLAGADLREVVMDAVTRLRDIKVDTDTRFCDVVWNNTQLTQVEWPRRLGDERDIKKGNRHERITALRNASRAYRGLALTLREQGWLKRAADYRLRELRLRCWARLLEGNLLAWIGLGLLDLVAGYGERPGRIFASYLVVVLGFALAYFGIVHQFDPTHAVDALVYSLTSFHGRGFFPSGAVTPHDPPVVLAALEAVVGLFIELMLIATFSRRFLGN